MISVEFQPADIQDIWMEILKEKIIKKNAQYGNSVYDVDTVFSAVGDPEELIKIRLDDKMRRLKTLDPESSKYDSELMEIVAYIMHLLNWRRNSGEEKLKQCEKGSIKLETGDCSRHERDKKQTAEYLRKVCDSHLPTLGLRRLSDK